MTKVLIVISAADRWTLDDGTARPSGTRPKRSPRRIGSSPMLDGISQSAILRETGSKAGRRCSLRALMAHAQLARARAEVS